VLRDQGCQSGSNGVMMITNAKPNEVRVLILPGIAFVTKSPETVSSRLSCGAVSARMHETKVSGVQS
jgi:hypothetical protein